MIETIKKLFVRYRHIVMYTLVGCVSTALNIAIFYLLWPTGVNDYVRNSVAWTGANLHSFFANRYFVFQSTGGSTRKKLTEFGGFMLSRVFSLVAENVIFMITASMGLSGNVVKVPATVFVIALNYLTVHIVFNGFRATFDSIKYYIRAAARFLHIIKDKGETENKEEKDLD